MHFVTVVHALVAARGKIVDRDALVSLRSTTLGCGC